MADFSYERELISAGFTRIAGVDEVGRGALCGPVVAAAVVFAPQQILEEREDWIQKIDDSKILTSRQRERLFSFIVTQVEDLSLGFCSPLEIDEFNIGRASQIAMSRAINQLPHQPDFILVDGFHLDGVDYSQRKVIGGDRKSRSIAAASIVAKVTRDWVMSRLDEIWGVYQWAQNKGYGTKAHFEALATFGPCIIHRLTFNWRGK